MRRHLVSILVAALATTACATTSTRTPEQSVKAAPHIYVELLLLEVPRGYQLGSLDPDELVREGQASLVAMPQILAKDRTPAELTIGGASDGAPAYQVELTPTIQNEHVRLALNLKLSDGSNLATTTVVVGNRQRLVLQPRSGVRDRALFVVVTAEIVRSNSDLHAIFQRKLAARTAQPLK